MIFCLDAQILIHRWDGVVHRFLQNGQWQMYCFILDIPWMKRWNVPSEISLMIQSWERGLLADQLKAVLSFSVTLIDRRIGQRETNEAQQRQIHGPGHGEE